MADDATSALPQMLMRIQEDIAAFRKDVSSRLDQLEMRMDKFEMRMDKLETRFDRLGELARKQRRDSAGFLVMMRATAGDFDARVTEVERQIMDMEQVKS